MTGKSVRSFFAAALLTSLFLCTAAAKTEFFKLEDLQPGMRGIGKTCVQGVHPEEFQVEILGTLRGINPGVSVALARFSGGPLDRTGIFEGMSGSPVYINGKLLGAVAYSFTFTKEAIGGITPITEMVDAFSESAAPVPETKVLLNGESLLNLPSAIQSIHRDGISLRVLPEDVEMQPSLSAFGGRALVPIATPLSMGGFHSRTLNAFGPRFRSLGLSLLQGAGGAVHGSGRIHGDSALLEPGANLIIPLVRGDFEVSAGGTVTHVDGKRLYAFGHSMLELGFTELPLHKGSAIAVVPSLESSFKILEIGEQAGTIRQDRGVGVYGIVGEMPPMVPVRVQLTTSRGVKKEFKYEIVRDPLLTPLLVNLTVYNTIAATERAQGTVTLRVKGKINIKNEQSVVVDNGYSADADAPNAAALSVAVPVNYLMAARYSDLDIQNISLEISVEEKNRAAALDSVRLPRHEVKAGESVEVEVTYKKINGEVVQERYPVKIPTNASPGNWTMLVADGSTLMALDAKEEGESLIPRDLTQLIKYINSLRKSDRLYIRIHRHEPGAIVKGEGMPGLPPSILAILKSERKVGALSSIQTSTLAEYEMAGTQYMVTGAKAIKLAVMR
jgi:hypothetical protein